MTHLKTLAALFFALLPAAAFAAPPASMPPVSTPPDVPPGHFAAGAVGRVVKQSIMGTAKDGRFNGNQPVTRYELAVALDRFVQYIEAGPPAAPHSNVSRPPKTSRVV